MTKRFALLFILLAWCAGAAAQRSGKLMVQVPAVLDQDAPISYDVRAECRLPEVVGDYTLQYVNRHLRRGRSSAGKIAKLEEAGDGRVVAVTILAVYGHGATAWAGAKSITLRADLIEGGKVIDSTVVVQVTRLGGVLGTLGGACDMFERASRAAANHIGRWASTSAFAEAKVLPNRQIAVETPARFEKNAPMPEGVTQDCALPMVLATHVFHRVSLEYPGTRMVKPGEPSAPANLLRLAILEVEGSRGGSVSGAKVIVVRADVIEDGKVTASKVFDRSASSAPTAMQSTCAILERAAIDIGKQITTWVPSVTRVIARSEPLRESSPGEVRLEDLLQLAPPGGAK